MRLTDVWFDAVKVRVCCRQSTGSLPSKYRFVIGTATDACRRDSGTVLFVYKSVKHKRGKAWGAPCLSLNVEC